MTLRANLLVALAALLFATAGRADDPLLPGMIPTNADSKADIVFIGKVSNADWGETEEGPLSLSVDTLRMFRGNVSSPTVLVIGTNATRCVGYLRPKVGDSYVFFIIKSNAGLKVYKVLPATDENVTLTKKLISKLSHYRISATLDNPQTLLLVKSHAPVPAFPPLPVLAEAAGACPRSVLDSN